MTRMPIRKTKTSISKKFKKDKSRLDSQLQSIIDQQNKLNIEERNLLNRTRPEPLTLLKQSSLAKVVGTGAVNLEFKRLNRIKKRERARTLLIFKKARESLDKKRLELLNKKSKRIKLRGRTSKKKKVRSPSRIEVGLRYRI